MRCPRLGASESICPTSPARDGTSTCGHDGGGLRVAVGLLGRPAENSAQRRQVWGFLERRPAVFFLNFLVHFFPVHGNVPRRIDAQLHLVASHVNDDNLYVIADHDAFVALAGQYQHGMSPSLAALPCCRKPRITSSSAARAAQRRRTLGPRPPAARPKSSAARRRARRA